MNTYRIPVIVGVGELADRPTDLADAREPVDLMAAALISAERDAAAPLLRYIDGLEIINEISWPYPDPCSLLRARLALGPVESTYHPVGGQTPMLAIHRAALAIQSGSLRAAAICGAESQASVTAARRAGFKLDWNQSDPEFVPIRGATYQQPIARRLDFASPPHVYPFYESATRAAWGQSLTEAQDESVTIWANNAAVARDREAAWIKRDIDKAEIGAESPDNRMIAWPYTKLMMANPGVNQGAGIIMCSLGLARELGVQEQKIVYFLGGAAADEPRDYLARHTYARSPAMEFTLRKAKEIVGGDVFDAVELYSCFPVVPKMARRTLDLPMDAALSVAGGLTFFGAPLNNYMLHATVAMVERLRHQIGTGLLYGQGEYVTKHHAIVLGSKERCERLPIEYRRSEQSDRARMASGYLGPARAEAATVLFDRQGAATHGGVILITPTGERVLGRVPSRDRATLAAITSDIGVIGCVGAVSIAADDIPEWRIG